MGLLRRPRPARSDQQPFVSIVVAARNEEAYIGACIASLSDQTYPADRYEIIVVDDDSTDTTRDVIKEYAGVRCLAPSPEFEAFAAKKRPMATGIDAAQGEIILTTDADCTAPTTWVESIVSSFGPDTDVVVGYSKIARVSDDLVHRFQSFDFFTLLSAAAGAIRIGRAWAATGQNLAYRRRMFVQVGGFSTISARPSGDDVLLLQLFRRAGAAVSFCAEEGGHITTWRSETLSGLTNQRRRWASNAQLQLKLNPAFFAYMVSVFSVAALPVVALILQGNYFWLFAIVYGLRLPIDGAVVWLGRNRIDSTQSLAFFPVWMLCQVPYILIVGAGGTLLGFKWKERTHTQTTNTSNTHLENNQPGAHHVTM